MKIVVAGYYGCGNLGDDALLQAIVNGLSETSIQIVAMSGDPDRTFRALGVRSIPRRSPVAFKTEMETASALVLGGGGLFQDVTSVFSLFYYAGLIQHAKRAGKRVVLLAQGVGPINSYWGKRKALAAFKMCDAITVRDARSLTELRNLGVKGNVEITADLGWLVKPSQSEDPEFQLGDMKAVAVCPRPWKGIKNISSIFGEFLQLLYKNQYMPVLVEMDRSMDTQILDAIAKNHGGRCLDIRNVLAPSDMVARIQRMHAVVSMRLHAGIFAASCGIAPTMIAYDPKVSSFVKDLNLPTSISADGLSARSLWDAFETTEGRREELDKFVQEKRKDFETAAQRNIDMLVSNLDTIGNL